MQKSLSARWLKRFLIGIGIVILLLFAGVQLFLNSYLEHLIEKRLASVIVKGSDSLYRFKMHKVNVSFWAGKVEVKNLQIRVDSIRYAELENTKSLPRITFEIDLPRGVIEGIDILPLLVSRKIKAQDIVSSDAIVKLSRHFQDTGQNNNKTGQPLWKLIKNDINEITVGKFILDSVKLHYSNVDSAKGFRWQFDHCSARFDNILIDSVSQADSDRIMFANTMAIEFNEVRLKTVDSFYWINAAKIFFTSEKNSLEVQKFSMHPAMTTREFYQKEEKQKELYDLKVDSVNLSNFKLQRFINNDEILADSVLILKPDINIYVDRTFPAGPENKLGKYPPQLLQNAPVIIRIKKVNVTDGNVTYIEKDFENLGEGKLSITNILGVLTNITNKPSDIIEDSICRAVLTAKFLKRATVRAQFDFFLSNKNGAFAVEGKIKDVDGPELNPVTVPLAKTFISSLIMYEMSFAITGNEQQATGNMHMRYNNLVVQLNRESKSGGGLKKSKFLTRLINKFMIRNDNPSGNKPEKVAQNIKHVRDPNKSFFALLWQTLFACIEVIATNVRGFTS